MNARILVVALWDILVPWLMDHYVWQYDFLNRVCHETVYKVSCDFATLLQNTLMESYKWLSAQPDKNLRSKSFNMTVIGSKWVKSPYETAL